MPARPAQEIAHGVVTSEPDGSFTIPFVAKPDLSVPEKDEPSFRYTVTADVTDTTGETRSGSKSVNVGYVALPRHGDRRRVAHAATRTTTFAITTTTLDGEGQAAKGTLKIYALKQPEKVARPDIDGGYCPRFRAGAAADRRADCPTRASRIAGNSATPSSRATFDTNGNGKADATAQAAGRHLPRGAGDDRQVRQEGDRASTSSPC